MDFSCYPAMTGCQFIGIEKENEKRGQQPGRQQGLPLLPEDSQRQCPHIRPNKLISNRSLLISSLYHFILFS